MTATNLFARIVTARQVERAMADHLDLWMRTYLREIERVSERPANSIADPKAYIAASDIDKWPEDSTPCVVITSPGLTGPPDRRGDSSYEATWGVGVVPVVGATDEVSTRDLALDYTAAVRAAVMQNRSLGGFAAAVTWLGESYDEVPFEATRTLGAGHVAFGVTVEDVLTEQAGPLEPLPVPEDDPGNWPDATIVDTVVNNVPITEALT